MGKKDPRIDAYIEKAAPFAKPILRHLRKAVHSAVPEVEETIKWSMPHFDYRGIFCGMGAFKAHCTFGFWRGSMLKGVAGMPDRADEAMGHLGRITSLDDLPDDRTLSRLLKAAAKLNEEAKAPGKGRPAKPRVAKRPPLEAPDYFLRALRKNAAALRTYQAFSPSHQREYVEWVTEAKREETRQRRLEQAVAQMAEGKTQHWKYERK